MLASYAAAAFVALCVGTVIAAPMPTETYKTSVFLDGDSKFKLYWKIEGTTITFETHVETLGWVGFGLSPSGSMTGADMIIGWVANGVTTFNDRHASGSSMPDIDSKEDWTLISGSESNGFTVLKFKRQLITADCSDDLPIYPDTLRLIWAYNPTDPTSSNQISKHTMRGTKSLNLMDPQVNRTSSLPANLLKQTFLNPAVKVPSATTTYWCTVFKMPALTKKHHMVMVEPVIQPGNTANVHHMLGYACYTPLKDSSIGVSVPCFLGQLPSEVFSCQHAIMLWGPSGEPFYFPDNVGFPLGEAGDPLYLMLQTHYDNPQQRTDIIDSSGFMISYTPDLRPIDAGALEVGNIVGLYMFVPPNVKEFQISGFCSEDCTKQLIPSDGINVFASALHTHMIGRKVRIRQFRNQQDIGNIGRDENFDFNYQQTIQFTNPKKVLPGDTMLLECVYDSSMVNQVTFGGLSTKEEMCIAFLFYYPRIDISVCQSGIHPEKQFSVVQSHKTGISFEQPKPDTTFWTEIVKQATWDSNMVSALRKLQTSSDIMSSCLAKNGTMYPSSYFVSTKMVPFPSYVAPLADKRDSCTSASTPLSSTSCIATLLLLCLHNL